MKRRLVSLTFVLAVAAAAVAAGQGARSSHHANKLSVTLRFNQGVTARHPHPPAGDSGDVFTVDLTLFTIGDDFDIGPNKHVGDMTYSWVPDDSFSCSVGTSGCKGTVDITTMTKLPGGTISAGVKNSPGKPPFVVSVSGGTGRYKGAKGTIVIAPGGVARNVYRITLPS